MCLSVVLLTGCFFPGISHFGGSWHHRFGWRAEDYFNDPKVIDLCYAIEEGDFEEIDRLIQSGADVNARGKGNMTPLLWAFPDNQVERFKRILKHGADPNVLITEDLGTRGALMPGMAVTHFATETKFPGYFEAVFEHGGDPNLVMKTAALGSGDTPLFIAIRRTTPRSTEKVRVLVEKGADLSHVGGNGVTALMRCVTMNRFDIAVQLLNAGADPLQYRPDSNLRVVHLLASALDRERSAQWSPRQRADFEEIVRQVQAKGESLDAARTDLKRWNSWPPENGEYRRRMAAEVAERVEREKQGEP